MAFGSQPWMSASAGGGAGGPGTGLGAMYIPSAYNSSGTSPDYNATNTLRGSLFFEGPPKTFSFSGRQTDSSLANAYPAYNVAGSSWTVSFWLRFPPHPGFILYQNTYSNNGPQVVPNNYNGTAPEWIGANPTGITTDVLTTRTFVSRGTYTCIESRTGNPSGFQATSLIEQSSRGRWGYSAFFKTGSYQDTGRYGNIQGVPRGNWNTWQHIVISVGHDTWGSGVSSGSNALDQGLAVFVNGVRLNAQGAGAFYEDYTGGHIGPVTWTNTATPKFEFYGDSKMISNYYFVDGETLGPDDFRQTVGGSIIPKLYEGSLGNHGYHYAFETDYAVTRQGSDPLNMAVNEVTSLSDRVQFISEQVAQGEWDGGTFSAP